MLNGEVGLGKDLVDYGYVEVFRVVVSVWVLLCEVLMG